jgi:hypothetical protein
MARNRRTVRENVMVRAEWRIAPAALATLAALAGAAVCIHGLLFDQTRVHPFAGSGTTLGGLM